jgi:NAD(P)-dependent dehydrogenase (short-subunit alcohol dehydrogenase family)
MSDQTILVTVAAGFIGFHIVRQLLAEGHKLIGFDNLNSYYDPALKQAGLNILRGNFRFSFEQVDLAHPPSMAALFARHRFAVMVHLAAQAGVRHSIDHPHACVDANLVGFVNLLEGCRHNECRVKPTDPGALQPADAVVVAVAHDSYVGGGWPLITQLLAGGTGLVLDVKMKLDRGSRPSGIELWRP